MSARQDHGLVGAVVFRTFITLGTQEVRGKPSDHRFKQEAKDSTEPPLLVVGSQSCTPGNAKMIKLMVLHILYLISKAANQQPST